MPDLLLELGCEELPAAFVRRAYCDLAANVEAGLREAGIPFEQGEPPLGTPRRLICHFKNVADRQPDQSKEQRGPALGSAFDADGAATKALEGFCRGQGLTVDQLEKRDGYVWANKTIPGRPTVEVLANVLPAAIKGLSFDKSMRWGSARMRFARPIKWILASFGGQSVQFDIEGVESGVKSRGHRFYAPAPFEATTYDALLNGLLERKVEADPAQREKTIREVAIVTASGVPQMDDALVDENVFLTEWPTPIEGTFNSDFLTLPEPVLITAMAKHEKVFPVRDSAGKLTNKFIFVRNSGEDATVRGGSEWVLNARFNDAKFFFDEDKKSTLDDFLAKTETIVFQEKLGTVRARANRISALAGFAAVQFGFGAEAESAKQAGLYAKADLATGLVGELANLQGVIGGEYARREGKPAVVCEAIARQYDLRLAGDGSDAASRVALCVLIADQVDKLVGYLGIGQVPSGSSDPYGLRRAVTMLIEASHSAQIALDGEALVRESCRLYKEQGVALDEDGALGAASEIFASRYESIVPGKRYDHVAAAVMAQNGFSAMRPAEVRFRLNVIEEIAGDAAFIQTATRPLNIVRSAIEKGQAISDSVDTGALNSAEGATLAQAVDAVSSKEFSTADTLIDALKSLEKPINAFFDSTMIMSQVEAERNARLALLGRVCAFLNRAGDFTKIVIEGE